MFANSGASVSAVPVMPESLSYMRKKFWKVTEARVWFSLWTWMPSLASTAWCSPSDQRRPGISRPVNSSTMITSGRPLSPALTT